MKDLIRSPLQFVRPMTEQEWQELMLREKNRRARSERRRREQMRRRHTIKPAAARLEPSWLQP